MLTLIDITIALAILVSVALGAIVFGLQYGLVGWIGGGIFGLVSLYILRHAFLLLESLWYMGFPRLPRCRNGTCRASDYSVVSEAGYYLMHKCRCGLRYVRASEPPFGPSEIFEVLEGGDVRPYQRWREFRGWTASGPFTQNPSPDRRITGRNAESA